MQTTQIQTVYKKNVIFNNLRKENKITDNP